MKFYTDVIGKVRSSNAEGPVDTSIPLKYFIMTTAIWHNSYPLITDSRTHIYLQKQADVLLAYASNGRISVHDKFERQRPCGLS